MYIISVSVKNKIVGYLHNGGDGYGITGIVQHSKMFENQILARKHAKICSKQALPEYSLRVSKYS